MNKGINIIILLLTLLIVVSCDNNVGLEENVIRNPFERDTLSIDTTIVDYKKIVITTIVVKKDTIRDTVIIVDTPREEISKGKIVGFDFREIHDLKNNRDFINWQPVTMEKITSKIIYSMGITYLQFDCDISAKEIDFNVGFLRFDAVKNFKIKININVYDLLNSPLYVSDFASNSEINAEVTIMTKDSTIIENPYGMDLVVGSSKVSFSGYKITELGIYFGLIIPSTNQKDPKNPYFGFEGEILFDY